MGNHWGRIIHVANEPVYFVSKRFYGQRFENIGINLGLGGLGDHFTTGFRGNHHDRQIPQFFNFADVSKGFQSVHNGHVPVHDQKIDLIFPYDIERLFPVIAENEFLTDF